MYNQLMRNELLSATDLGKIQDSPKLIFEHISCKLKLFPYPICRAFPLVKTISYYFNDQLLDAQLSYTPLAYETFDRLLAQTMNIFRIWDNLIKKFMSVAREVTRKRQEKFIPIKVVPAHAKLQARKVYFRDWRKRCEQLVIMTGPTKGLGGVGEEVEWICRRK
jgi:hypothetical protein